MFLFKGLFSKILWLIHDSIGQFYVDKFNENGSFTMWQIRMNDVLAQQGFYKALQGKIEKSKGIEDGD